MRNFMPIKSLDAFGNSHIHGDFNDCILL